MAIVLAAVASCASGTPAANPAPPVSATSPAVSEPPTSPRPAATAAHCDTSGWRSAPVSVTRVVVLPPVPAITAIRTAAHPECGYDRLVLDITGQAPSYEIRYVTRVTADPSGKPITLPGHGYLLVTLRPAQAHAGSGAPTIGPAQTLGYPVLTSYALAGDFEGVVTLALGLNDTTGFRAGELPGRWFIDVRA